MSDQDPFKSDINYHTGQFHTSAEKLAAGVNYGDSSWSAADKLRRYNENNGSTYGGSGGGGIAALAVVAIVAFYYAIKNTVGPFKRATGINAFVFLTIACFTYGMTFYIAGTPQSIILASSDKDNWDLYNWRGFITPATPDVNFFGQPKKYVSNEFYSVSDDMAEIYNGILTKNEISKMYKTRNIYGDPSVSEMRAIAASKGLAQEFDQRTLDHLNETFRKYPKYKDANFIMNRRAWTVYKSGRNGSLTVPVETDIITYSMEEK